MAVFSFMNGRKTCIILSVGKGMFLKVRAWEFFLTSEQEMQGMQDCVLLGDMQKLML